MGKLAARYFFFFLTHRRTNDAISLTPATIIIMSENIFDALLFLGFWKPYLSFHPVFVCVCVAAPGFVGISPVIKAHNGSS